MSHPVIDKIKNQIVSKIEICQFTNNKESYYRVDGKRELCIDYINIFFASDDYIKIQSCGDCCSTAWIRQDNMDKINDLIGKKIVSFIEDTTEDVNFEFSDVQESDDSHKYIITTEDGYEFVFFLTNSSNGYYSGTISVEYIKSPGEKLGTKITFVIGLPGSGKTHLFTENAFDDFLTTKRNEIDIHKLISENTEMYIIDPLFTDIETFKQYYNIFAKYVKRENISVILFRADSTKCRENLQKDIICLYETLAKKLKIRFEDKLISQCNNAVAVIVQRIISLTNMSKNYNLEKYIEFNPTIIDVY